MGMTMTQKIMAAHAGKDSVKAGDLIYCTLDMTLANDITAPPSIKEFEKIGCPVFDRTKIALVPDHYRQASPRSSATSRKSTTSNTITKWAAWASNMCSFRNRASSRRA